MRTVGKQDVKDCSTVVDVRGGTMSTTVVFNQSEWGHQYSVYENGMDEILVVQHDGEKLELTKTEASQFIIAMQYLVDRM